MVGESGGWGPGVIEERQTLVIFSFLIFIKLAVHVTKDKAAPASLSATKVSICSADTERKRKLRQPRLPAGKARTCV